VVSTTGAHHTHTLAADYWLMSCPSNIRLQSYVWRHQEERKVVICTLCCVAAVVLASVSSFISFSFVKTSQSGVWSQFDILA